MPLWPCPRNGLPKSTVSVWSGQVRSGQVRTRLVCLATVFQRFQIPEALAVAVARQVQSRANDGWCYSTALHVRPCKAIGPYKAVIMLSSEDTQGLKILTWHIKPNKVNAM